MLIIAAAALVTLALSLILVLFTRPLVLFVFGPRYLGSVLVCRLLVPGMFCYGVTQVLYGFANAKERPWLSSLAEAVGVAVTVVGVAVTVKPFGLVGAALSSTAGYVATFFVMIFLTRRMLTHGHLQGAD